MKRASIAMFTSFLVASLSAINGICQESRLQKCTLAPNAQDLSQGQRRRASQPRCGIEMTCTDGFIQVGYSDGVCFRASCPGIWAILHRRVDQASFRRRLIIYRHYNFQGYWELKSQGTLESGLVTLRELFLVLPDDLIEFRLADPDCLAKVELKNFGYVKKGSICELQKWLARHRYFANVQEDFSLVRRGRGLTSPSDCIPGWSKRSSHWIFSTLYSLGSCLGFSGGP
jgi:hypothetical protein